MKWIIGTTLFLMLSWWVILSHACETTTYVLDGRVYVCTDCGNNVITCN
jgi:hypothetical protein